MKIKKEVWLVAAIVAFLVSYLIDRLSGPVIMNIGNPTIFLRSPTLLHTYPFTATAIIIRTVAIFISSMLVISLFERKYFTKAVILFFVGLLSEFFAIQQLATGFRVTTIQWTLSIAYGSLSLILAIAWMVLKGVWSLFNKEESVSTTTESSS